MPKFPFTNYHELNLDWILKEVKALFTASEENAKTIRTYDNRLNYAELTATNAGNTATAAQQLADAAAANADNALSVADTADSKADSALTAATNASGAASGALTVAQEARQIAGNAQSEAADADALANDANNAAAAAQQTADTNAGNIATLQNAVDTLSDKVPEIDNKADVIISSASGSIANFADGADDMAIRSLVVNIEPVQTGSGDPSPTNIRPIIGHTGAEIEQRGANLFDKSTVVHGYKILGTGQIYPDSNVACTDFIAVKQGVTLYCSPNLIVGLHVIFFYDSTKQLIGKDFNNTHIYSVPDNCCYIRINMLEAEVDSATVNYPSTDTSYHPYTGNTLSVTFPSEAGTVYSGTLDVTNGVLTVDRAIKILNGSASDGTYSNPSTNRFNVDNIGIDYIKGNYLTSSGISSIYPSVDQTATNTDFNSFASTYDYAYNLSSSDGIYAIRIKDTRFTTIEEIKSYFSSNNVQFLIKLRNPQTYQLTPQELDTLLGTNNIWTDVGTIDVEYPADTKLYIDGKIAELQALVLEN